MHTHTTCNHNSPNSTTQATQTHTHTQHTNQRTHKHNVQQFTTHTTQHNPHSETPAHTQHQQTNTRTHKHTHYHAHKRSYPARVEALCVLFCSRTMRILCVCVRARVFDACVCVVMYSVNLWLFACAVMCCGVCVYVCAAHI